MKGRAKIKKAKPGQVREWKYRHDDIPFDPNLDIFFVVEECSIVHGPNNSSEGVRVMYPDGFITEHHKRELERDSNVIV